MIELLLFVYIFIHSCWKLFPAYWASVMILQPWLDAIRVENMATRQEDTFVAYLKVGDANGAGWVFELSVFTFFAMLLLNFDFGKTSHIISICRSSCSFLFFLLSSLHLCLDQLSKFLEADAAHHLWCATSSSSLSASHLIKETR